MGVGHVAVGFACKRWAPHTSLAWLMLAPIFVDVLFSVFVLAGLERVRIVPGMTRSFPLDLEYIPISHSLVAVLGWGAALAALYFALFKQPRVALILFLGVSSHWLLDWVSHRPDMPVLPSGPRLGLGLWNYPLPAFLVEAGLLALGLWLYAGATRARGRVGRYGLWAFATLLFAMNCAAYLAPPPPDVAALAVGNLSSLLVLWAAHRVDRQRESHEQAAEKPYPAR